MKTWKGKGLRMGVHEYVPSFVMIHPSGGRHKVLPLQQNKVLINTHHLSPITFFLSYFPLSAMSSCISCSLMPTIASPRSSLSSASFFGSL